MIGTKIAQSTLVTCSGYSFAIRIKIGESRRLIYVRYATRRRREARQSNDGRSGALALGSGES